jgi:hypothetical protein
MAAEELHPGDTVEFGVSRISSVRVQDMQQLGYFGSGVGRVPGVEEVPEPEGELVVFEVFFTAGLRLPAHRFMAEVLRRFKVQVHQLTSNAVVALVKYGWAATSYGGQWKSPRGGVNRANLKFINLSTTTSRVSVRNMNESEREGEKQIASK